MGCLFSVNSKKVRIFDTTLRDGEQAPGIDLTVDQKIRVAKRLAELGVDVIEAGFPASSDGEFEATKKILSEIGDQVEVTGLSRSVKQDIDRTIDTGLSSIHIFIATSDIHLKYKLKMTREEVLNRIYESVRYAKDHGLIVEYSPEDATRSDEEFLLKAVKTAIDAGADRINIPDTVGVMHPFKFYDLISKIVKVTGDKIVSVHCHNDFGLATANSIAGVMAGARQVHVTVNGIGERAGNASLEEVVMSLKKLLGYDVGVRTYLLYEVSRYVAELTGVPVPYFKAIVGENAFGHEAGIHVHGVIENPMTYEPISPEEVGNFRRIALGKHSGIHGLKRLLEEQGIFLDDTQLREVLKEIKSLAEAGNKVTSADAKAIAIKVINKKITA
ncbi:isopropylmalate synthase [Sulfolobus acidocaldarius]|uniref:2-isopropylmalate synthase n=4 Tax=Sulfolobus acidocaldarius TaxID=2285 RepID=LEU1_SULAC|nr:isopropylmalate synthase [Sulfolobus acidocaldarius]Q4JA78.1 RecName: Full=2-isopropylmalate synthase; Short=IPMS; AltName: Full=Alpha-isopropylmalate synthase; Short=Alpha-IPM synthase [Sulfolobus acidocaldarius DSM 639]AAY80302.1 2-isopropylmalate synthase [Sulfolobus acidocaldarius DSM 639]AGE70883.1 trans-homoaconitate synthase [Sulfolobus acidocaldarius N8]AGE73154.1 trans-homoaconitate synthase [Sulfolobus acidocaldarius Ron12/I]ALU28809.1 homoaconitate hydratase [Sulfolobus acidocald